MNFVEIPSDSGPLFLNLDHVTSVQVRDHAGNPALAVGFQGTTELQSIACKEAQTVYEFLREQIRPTSFVSKKESPVGFGKRTP